MGRERVIDGLQSEEEDVGEGLAATGRETRVITQNATVGGKDGEEILEVVRLDVEVGGVGARSQSNVDGQVRATISDLVLAVEKIVTGADKVGQEVDDTGERLCLGKQLLLQRRVLLDVLLLGDGEAGPVVEDLVGGGAWAALQSGLDRPGHVGLTVALEDDVDALSVDVLGV